MFNSIKHLNYEPPYPQFHYNSILTQFSSHYLIRTFPKILLVMKLLDLWHFYIQKSKILTVHTYAPKILYYNNFLPNFLEASWWTIKIQQQIHNQSDKLKVLLKPIGWHFVTRNKQQTITSNTFLASKLEISLTN